MTTGSAATIVVGVKDSPASRQAVEAGAREAAMHHCRLELVHAFNWLPTMSGDILLDPPPQREGLLRQAIAEAHDVAPDVPVVARTFEGQAAGILLRCSRTAAMTVIGDGGLCACTCLPCDAVSVQVAARAAGPVLVTRAEATPAGPVVAGINGSAACRRVLEFAFDAAARRQVPLVLVRAWEPGDEDAAEPTLGDAAGLTAALERRYGLTAQVRIVEGSPDTVLREAAQDAGLVVVGARGRHPYSGLLGWVAQTMLHHSPAPVAVVRGEQVLTVT